MTVRSLGRMGVLILAAVAMLATALVLGAETNSAAAQEQPTIADIAVGNDDFSTLVTALSLASESGPVDFIGTVSDPTADLTVFAPTNAAFAALGDTLTAALEDPSGLLTDVLLYHVLGSSELGGELIAAGSVETLLGQNVAVTLTDAGEVFVNDSQVIVADIEASNGIIHVIDAVLLPSNDPAPDPDPDPDPPEVVTIADIALGNPDFSTLVTALSVASESGPVDFLRAVSDPTADLTVFAPTNAAFAALGDTLDAVLADPDGLLSTVLAYHVLGSSASGGELIAAGSATTLQGEDIEITLDNDGSVFINNSLVLVGDIETDNGIIHVIDAVLLPPSVTDPAPEPDPEPTPQIVTIADVALATPDLGTLVTALTLASESGPIDFLAAAADPDADLTVFAPTNEAFAALGDDLLDAVVGDPSGLLTTVLAYHVLGSSEAGADLVAAGRATTLGGEDVRIEVRDGTVFVNDAEVIVADIETDNGIVHVIDAVLLPPSITNPEPDPAQSAFAANAVPGRIQAENFDNGGQGVGYNDSREGNQGTSDLRRSEGVDIYENPNSGAGPIIGRTVGGEWTEYTVTASAAGSYELVARVASGFRDPGFLRARVNGQVVGTVDGATGGWYDWDERSFGLVDLHEGENVVRIAWNGGGQVNFDWFELNPADASLPTIAEVAVGDERFSTLVTALSVASDAGPVDFLSVVSDRDADLTVFAPTNDAFAALGDTLGAALDDPSGLLTTVLAYHVLGSSEYGADLIAAQSAQTLTGQTVRVSLRQGGGVFINESQVVIADIQTANGIIHVIDAVLLPPARPTCGGLLQEAEDGVLSGNFVVQSPSAGARGDAYIEAPDGAGPANGDDWAEYCVTVEKAGFYRIATRVRAFDNTDDSFFVSVDGGPKALYDTPISSRWAIDSVSARGAAKTVRWYLEPGEHIVRFDQRENGTQLDAFQLIETSGPATVLR